MTPRRFASRPMAEAPQPQAIAPMRDRPQAARACGLRGECCRSGMVLRLGPHVETNHLRITANRMLRSVETVGMDCLESDPWSSARPTSDYACS